jgi:hypothetical protein
MAPIQGGLLEFRIVLVVHRKGGTASGIISFVVAAASFYIY